jgi:hypothetical protein
MATLAPAILDANLVRLPAADGTGGTMSNLFEQVEKSQFHFTRKYNTDKGSLKEPWSYEPCPLCGRPKTKPAIRCQRCLREGNRPPVVEGRFKIDGVYCRLIPLTRGLYAIVWESDYEWLMRFFWTALPSLSAGGFYASTSIPINGKFKAISMHKMIADPPDGKDADHKNRITIDNRRDNLRPCDGTEGNANRRLLLKNNTSGYKGVGKRSKTTYTAMLKYRGKMLRLGTFFDPKEAAKVYDRKALELFGEFAVLNFPELIEEYRALPKVEDLDALSPQQRHEIRSKATTEMWRKRRNCA